MANKKSDCESAHIGADVGAQVENTKSNMPPLSARERTGLERIWSRRMALLGLKRIYEAALEGARIEVRDGDGALVEVKFNPTAANAATRAIEAANRMLGYSAPEEEEEAASTLTVDLGDAAEFSE